MLKSPLISLDILVLSGAVTSLLCHAVNFFCHLKTFLHFLLCEFGLFMEFCGPRQAQITCVVRVPGNFTSNLSFINLEIQRNHLLYIV